MKGYNQGCPWYFPKISEGGGVELHDFALGGVRLQVFQREAPENGADGAVLEFFFDFSEKLSLKNAIKIKNLVVWG